MTSSPWVSDTGQKAKRPADWLGVCRSGRRPLLGEERADRRVEGVAPVRGVGDRTDLGH